MSNYYSDPTANAAIGSIDKEMKRLTAKAHRIRRLRERGALTEADVAFAHEHFRGYFRQLRVVALGE